MNKVSFFVTICVLMIATLNADTFLRYKKTTESYTADGKEVPSSTGESFAWIGKTAAVYDNGDGTRSIVHFKKRMLMVLDMAEKEYSVMHLDSMSSMLDNAMESVAGNAEQAEAMKAMMQGMMGDILKSAVSVKNSGTEKKIGYWNCRRFDVSMSIITGGTESEVWVTKDIKIDPALFNMVKNGVLAQMPGFSAIAEELKKVEGVPVKTVTRTQVGDETVTSTELLQENAEKPAPTGIYSIPDSFTKR